MKTMRFALGGCLLAAALLLPGGLAKAAPTVDDEGATTPDVETYECPIAPGDYAIGLVYGDRLVFDVANGSTANGANLQTYGSNDTAAQRFTVQVDDDGFATILSKASGKAIDVAGAKAASGTNVQLYEPTGSDAQRWRIVEAGDGAYRFESALNPTLVLDIASSSAQPGANVQIYANNGSKAQRFRLYPATVGDVDGGMIVTEGVYRLQSAFGNQLVADVAGGSSDNGARVQTYTSNDTPAQLWYVSETQPGFYTLQPINSGKELNVDHGSIVPGAIVHQWDGVDPNSCFAFHLTHDGFYQIICKANGYALDVAGSLAVAGTPLTTNPASDAKSQRWLLDPVESLLGDGGIYRIDSMVGAHRSVDVAGGATAPGTNVQQWTWNGTVAQRWLIEPVADEPNVYTIETLSSGLKLTRSGANVVVQPNNGSASQQWRPVPSPQGGISLVSVDDPTLVLDVAGAGNSDGVNIGVYEANGTIAQAFVPREVSPFGSGTFTIGFTSSGRVLDIAGASFMNGANVQISDANGAGSQAWHISENGSGNYSIVNARTGNAVDVSGGSFKGGANVHSWEPTGGVNQQWNITYEGNGMFKIRAARGDLVLTAPANAGFNGANVVLEPEDFFPAQLVKFEATSYRFSYDELYDLVDAAPSTWDVSTFGGNFQLSAGVYNELNDAVNRFRSAGFNVGIAVVDLDTGKGFTAGVDQVIYSACSIKASYVTSICRYDPWKAAGYKATIEPTVIFSNNETYYQLRAAFGSWPLERLMAEAHVWNVPCNTNYVFYRARDLVKLWVAIGGYLYSDEMNADFCRSIFSQTHYSYIHDVLSGNGCVTYSKPGWYPNEGGYGAFDDGGIVDRGGQRYAVAILSTAYERFDLTNPLVSAIDRAAWELR